MSKERFSLEDLSKISGARWSQQVLDFFHTLDTYITDEEVKTYMNIAQKNTVSASALRKDIVSQWKEDIRKTIIANFPDKKDTAIRVPQILS